MVLVWLLIAPASAQEALLRWNNGDVLPGKLLPSGPGQIRWASPVFADALAVDIKVLDAIDFPGQRGQSAEAFRIGTVAGDVFTADLRRSTEKAFLFSSRRHGSFQVARDLIYSLRRIANPNLTFDGSQFGQWQRLMNGPIRNLSYKAYKGDWGWGAPFPDLSRLTPADEARFTAGYLDLGLSRHRERFAMSFQGNITVPATGTYRFEGTVDDEVQVWIDGKQIPNVAQIAHRYRSELELAQGSHSLRLDYVDLGGEARLSFWLVNAQGQYTSLAESNPTSGWFRGMGGHPQTQRRKASLWRRVKLPHNFEIDLELLSSSAPRFVLALGQGRENTESPQTLRLETWGDELVVVQDTVFEPVLTIPQDMRELRLQLTLDSDAGALRVFDASGVLLITVKGIRVETGLSGITLRNRGEDLCVRRLGIYRQASAKGRQVFDAAQARVHLMDGQVLYGRLHVTGDGASVIDRAGTRHEFDLAQLDRIARPDAQLAVTPKLIELNYADGAILRGRIEQANSDQVTLRTAFSDRPLPCALAGASLLRFNASATQTTSSDKDMDQLYTAAGRLRGRLSFDLPGSPLSWQVPGTAKPLRLARGGAGRIDRSSQSVTQGASFDKDQYPHLLHLKNSEIIPCRVLSYDPKKLRLESPFIEHHSIDSPYIKAIEFSPLTRRRPAEWPTRQAGAWLQDVLGPEQKLFLGVDPVRLERALTVPRFSRGRPPSHILVARNGDLKRGRLLGLNPQTLQFESKLRKQIVPLSLMARIVNVTGPQPESYSLPMSPTDLAAQVRASLVDGSILTFKAVESTGGKLIGRSYIYGDMAVPIQRIQELSMGGFAAAPLASVFNAWVLRPAQEPILGRPSGATETPGPADMPIPTPPEAPPPPSKRALALAPDLGAAPANTDGKVTETQLDPVAPKLGKVRIDPQDRSLRFPVTLKQRNGPVDYVLVSQQGKTPKSVFQTDVQPRHIHLGLLLLDATPSYARQLPTDPAQPLPGEPVHVGITWTENGIEGGSPLEYFVVTTSNAARLSRGPWVYNGSVMTDTGLAAERTGSIVSLRRDPGALINNPRPGHNDDEIHQANPKAFPADITEFQMVIRLVREKDSG